MANKIWPFMVLITLVLTGCSWHGIPIKSAEPVRITVFKECNEINPEDREYPGGRGTNELIVYTPGFGPRTGTNIWGVEAVVENDMVVKVEGNNSVIPREGFVISGHGDAKRWILANIHPGSKVTLQGKQIKVTSGPEVFITKAENILAKTKKAHSVAIFKGRYIAPQFDRQFDKAEKLVAQAKQHLEQDKLEKAWRQAQAAYEQAFCAYGLIIAEPEITARGAWYRVKVNSANELKEVVEKLARSNFNMIFPETIYEGGTLYASPEQLIPQHPEFGGWDPLRVLIKEAHRHNIEVHAWIHIFFVGMEDSPLVQKYGPWLARNYKGELASSLEAGYYYFCPAQPQARRFILDNLKFLVENYDLDGLQLDYIRYPSSDPYEEGYCYCQYCRQLFSQLYKADPKELSPDNNPELWQKWNQFREQQITSFVAEVNRELKAIKPELKLSAAVFADLEHARAAKFQNWLDWAKSGIVDFLCHMAYSSDTDWVGEITKEIHDSLPANFPFYIGIAAYIGLTPELLVDQILAARDNRAQGVTLFALNYLSDETLRLLACSAFLQPPEKVF